MYIQVQYAFFRLLLSLLRNYRDFIVFPTPEERNNCNKPRDNCNKPRDTFRKKPFLQVVPLCMYFSTRTASKLSAMRVL